MPQQQTKCARSVLSPRVLPQMLTARELEALLKIDVKTIYSYVQRGLIPYVKIQSNVRFVKDDILDWLDARRHMPSPRPAARMSQAA